MYVGIVTFEVQSVYLVVVVGLFLGGLCAVI